MIVDTSRVLWFRCTFVLALCVVTALSLTPSPELPINLWDKANHALAYFFLAYLGDHAFPSSGSSTPRIMVLVGLFIYGVLIEILQSQIPSRQASTLDMIANASGLGLYTLLHYVTRYQRSV